MFKIIAKRSSATFIQVFQTYAEAKAKEAWLKENEFTNIILEYNAHAFPKQDVL